MTDFVYILEVDYLTALSSKRCRLMFSDRDEAEEFRKSGEYRGYKVVHLNAYPAYTAEKAWRRIKEEKEHHLKLVAERLDDEIKTMI